MNCGQPNELPHCFLNLNWDQSMDPNAQLDSALNSMVSSQAPNLLNQSEIATQSHYSGNTELNLSMGGGATIPILPNLVPMNHLDQFPADPGFAERAARLSCFDGRDYAGFVNQFDLCAKGKRLEIGLIGGNQVSQFHEKTQLGMNNSDLGICNNGRDESSVSDPASIGLTNPSESTARKRKAVPKAKAKDTPKISEEKESNDLKRCKSVESNGTQDEQQNKTKTEQKQSGSVSTSENESKKQGKGCNSKNPEPPKDYIHVRARRGEATDSHSLAERVRREKISQRMKLLQDLVPGCNKVVGKAVMLDEIINYVQSLQRQVEFLSMKLATVNPQLDFNNLPSLLAKDMSQTCGPLLNPSFPLDTSGSALPFTSHSQPNPLHFVPANGVETQPIIHQLNATHSFLNGVTDPATSQMGAFWHDDLNNVLPMEIRQNGEEITVPSQGFNGAMQSVHMKMEL